MAVPVVDLLNNSDSSSDEDFSDSEVFYSSEDESMEDEPSESEITTAKGTLITLSRFLILSSLIGL